MIRRYAAAVVLLALSITAKAQNGAGFGFQYQPAAKIVEGADTLRQAWVGGMNMAQFSNIDLNGDGQNDLFAFDRQSRRCYTFLNVAKAGGGRQWEYSPDYEKLFPADLNNWALLRDYNCDGRPDLFTGHASGTGFIRVFRNVAGSNGRPSFALAADTLSFTGFATPSKLLIDSSSMPDIRDVNGDGKLDIVSYFFFGATNMELYLNNSSGCGGLDFTLGDAYWGRLEVCGACTGFNMIGGRRCFVAKGAHTTGHNTTLLDLDGDGDLDVLDGRDNCAQLTRLLNLGTRQAARFDTARTAMTSQWPTPAAPAQAGVFPGAYNVDANFDGRLDLLVAPNAFDNRSDKVTMRNTVKLLANTATGNVPAFGTPTGFLQPDMLDVSEVAAPAFGDIDGDGLLDMLVGNHGDAVGGEYRATLYYYRNVGTRTRPVFKLVTNDYLGLSSLGIAPNQFVSLKPQLVDLNRDRALDLVFSAFVNGANFIHYILNTAPVGQAAAFNPANVNYLKGRGQSGNLTSAGIIPYWEGDMPFFTDVDGDGYVDLLVGTDESREAGASLRYFRQLPGVRLDTAFAIVNNDYGRIRTATGALPKHLSPTVADFDGDGFLDLLTIDSGGIVQFITNFKAQGALFAPRTDLFYNALTNNYEEPRLGAGDGVRFAAVGADLNGDGTPELIIGTESGGLLSYKVGANVLASKPQAVQLMALAVYPNPATGAATVETGIDTRLTLFDLAGRALRQSSVAARQHTLDLNGLAAGLYLVQARAADGTIAVQRLEVK